mmetsp:Transcript_85441/g.169504  ORF Transcript_85441/g.169504 Transcript_85441/m.169504 type:complete len:279 (-) Transcript_85441:55-891(-)
MAPRGETVKEESCCGMLPELAGHVPEEPRQWRCFEFAELMEQGEGPGLTSTHAEPPRDRYSDQRLLVQRSQNRMEFQLTTEKGLVLLVARSRNDGARFDFFVPTRVKNSKSLGGPAFVLEAKGSCLDSWSLCSTRCEQCEARGTRKCGSQHLARMSHYSETVGEGEAFCMDLHIPELLEDGQPAVFCHVCNEVADWGTLQFTTRRPKWNARQKSLTLDFRGRCACPSSKNFQLEAVDNPGKRRLLFGKAGPQTFVLDYSHPLSAVQAFAAGLSASHWK